ncbi:uncharacterized WD repeat-containing protein alr2800 [Phtheirospermum japonicum]|uniref:Uncharacterized WD repeat-containing protein alr2800 n=1 Tax=Phtheirospermum japonicum TaxID=374723 RepID=A0A830C1Z1_9LAMI|nr:uncharacterized WD repeat-containing protein alr2800 [Phtheirospermum japonicum]
MRLRSCLPTRSSSIATSADSAAPSPTGPHSPPPTSIFSSEYSQTNSSSTSIQTSLSLLTLPSVPSLQKLTLSPQNDAAHTPATAVFLTSFNPSHSAHINFIAVHDNLLYVASGNVVNVYRTNNNSQFDTLTVDNASAGAVKSIAFRGGRIFTGHQDCKIRVWKLSDNNNHKLIAVLPTLEDRARRFILPQNYVKVRRHRKKLWIQHYDVVSGLAACQKDENNLVVSISWDKSIKIWRARDNLRCLESINKAHEDAINCVAVSKDGLVYTGSADTRIKAWKREGGKYGLVATLEKHKSAVNALALSVDGSVLFSGSCDRSILVWEKEDSANHMAVTGALRGHAKAILCLINVRDLLMSGSGDRTVRIWRRGFDGRFCCLAVLDGHRAPVRSLASEDGGGGVKVFSGSFDGEIRVWQVEVASLKGYD